MACSLNLKVFHSHSFLRHAWAKPVTIFRTSTEILSKVQTFLQLRLQVILNTGGKREEERGGGGGGGGENPFYRKMYSPSCLALLKPRGREGSIALCQSKRPSAVIYEAKGGEGGIAKLFTSFFAVKHFFYP